MELEIVIVKVNQERNKENREEVLEGRSHIAVAVEQSQRTHKEECPHYHKCVPALCV